MVYMHVPMNFYAYPGKNNLSIRLWYLHNNEVHVQLRRLMKISKLYLNDERNSQN